MRRREEETHAEHGGSEQDMHGLSYVGGVDVVVVGVGPVVVFEVEEVGDQHGRRDLEGFDQAALLEETVGDDG